MNWIPHYATCPGWETGQAMDCTCLDVPAWRIRKERGEQFPWRIWRHTGALDYEYVMRCSSWEGAMSLVVQFMWLRKNAIEGNVDV